MMNHIVMIAMQLDWVFCFALYWFGVPVSSASIDRSSAWELGGHYRGPWTCNRMIVLTNAAPPFSPSVPSPSNPRFRPFHGHVLCLCLLVSLPFQLVSSENLFVRQNAPFQLESSHDVTQGCGCAVGLREVRHPSDRKYWIYFLLPCFLRWRVILLYCLGCVGSHRRKIWMVHCFLGC